MYRLPRRPARGNWIWLGSGLITAAALSAAILHYPGGTCQAATGRGPLPGTARGLAAPRTGPADLVGPAGAAGLAGAGRDAGGARLPVHPASGSTQAARAIAVFYDPGAAAGSCTLGPLRATGHYVSLPRQRYGNGTACGSYLEIAGPGGRVRAEVVDLCPGCAANMINLSRTAFDRVVGVGPGSGQVTYWPDVNPRLPGPISLRVGATAGGLTTIQVINHGNPLRAVEVGKVAAGAAAMPAAWEELTPNTNDFWVAGGRLGPGPFTVRVTDDRGHQVLLRPIMLERGARIRTRVWMYRPRRPGTPPAAGRHTARGIVPVPAAGTPPATAGHASGAGTRPGGRPGAGC